MERDHPTLTQLSYQLETWRKSNSAPTPIPPQLWSEAAALAGRLGVGKVSKALRLEYGRLKQLAHGDNEPQRLQATFVELLPLSAHSLGDCAVEVKSAHGARMRIQIQNATTSSLASLIREFVA
jgi:hypothetical protein